VIKNIAIAYIKIRFPSIPPSSFSFSHPKGGWSWDARKRNKDAQIRNEKIPMEIKLKLLWTCYNVEYKLSRDSRWIMYCVYCSLLSTTVTLSLCMCVHVVVSIVQTCSNLLHCLFKFKLKYLILLFLCFISKLWQYCIIYSHAKKTILNLNLNSEKRPLLLLLASGLTYCKWTKKIQFLY